MHAHDAEAPASPDAPPSQRRSRSRRIRAILAGGLVLGVGAAVTLAAWSDSEFATGTFTAGTFNLQGATTSSTGTYTDHASSATAAPITFTTPLAGNMSPNSVVYAPFWVRLAPGTTTGATLDLTTLVTTETGGTANAANYTYSVYAIGATATCDGTATSGTLMGTGSLVDNASIGNSTVTLANGTPPTAAGAPTQLCFIVSTGGTLNQTTQTTATWQFVATSNAP